MSTRTTLTRLPEREVRDRDALLDLLEECLVGHLGVVVGDHPVVIPVAYAVDPGGPDESGTVYVHGSVAAGWLRRSPGNQICLTVTSVDGLVLARSAFHHSMNYRSAVVIGAARLVDDEAERARALDLIVDHVVAGRSGELRAHTRKELAATAVLAIPLAEASLKVRAGGPKDDAEDVEAGVWAGVLPLRLTAGPIESDPLTGDDVPEHVLRRASDFA